MKKLWKESRPLRQNLQKRLPVLASEYFAAGRIALAAGTSWDQMHQFRLATKRFRYTLEVFRSAYGPGIDARIEALKKVQTFLGDINDCIVTSAMLTELAGTEEVRLTLADKAGDKTRKLRHYWHREFDAPGEEQRWTRYLVTYVCRRRPLPRTRRIVAPSVQPDGDAEVTAPPEA